MYSYTSCDTGALNPVLHVAGGGKGGSATVETHCVSTYIGARSAFSSRLPLAYTLRVQQYDPGPRTRASLPAPQWVFIIAKRRVLVSLRITRCGVWGRSMASFVICSEYDPYSCAFDPLSFRFTDDLVGTHFIRVNLAATTTYC